MSRYLHPFQCKCGMTISTPGGIYRDKASEAWSLSRRFFIEKNNSCIFGFRLVPSKSMVVPKHQHPRKRGHQRSQDNQPINHHPPRVGILQGFQHFHDAFGLQCAVWHGDVLTIFDGLLQDLLLQTYAWGWGDQSEDRVPLNPFIEHRSPT